MGRTPVYIAARHNCKPATMRILIQAGGDLNVEDNYTYSPLMASSYNGAHLSLVGALLALGADIHKKDQMGRRALDWSREGQRGEITTYLDNIMVVPAMCAVYVNRLGRKSPLRLLPVEVIRMVRDTLVLPEAYQVRRYRMNDATTTSEQSAVKE